MSICYDNFGISFHPNMAIEDIAGLWCSRASDKVKAKYPQLNDLLQSINVTLASIKAARQVLIDAQKIQDGVLLAISAGSATIAGQAPEWVASNLGLDGARAAFNEVQDLLAEVGVELDGQLTCTTPSIPSTPQVDLTTPQTEVDKLFTQLDIQVNTFNCSQYKDLFNLGDDKETADQEE